LDERQQPLVSVIIPAYQAAEHIRETLDSMFAQTYPNFEVVLVNDGSPDTEALEQAIRSYGERLIYIRQENRGPSGARNTAIRAARGKYIACLDSDDIYLPEHLARLVPLLEGEALDLVYSDSHFMKDGMHVGRSFERQPQHPPVTFEKLLTEDCAVTTSAAVASRQAMIDAGLFDERYRRCEDFDLWVRMSFRGAKMGLLRQVGIEHRMLPDGLASDGYLLKQALIEIYRKVLTTLPVSAKQKSLIEALIARTEGLCQMDLAKRYLREGRYPEARVAAGKAAELLQNRKSRRVALVVQIAPLGSPSFSAHPGGAVGAQRQAESGFYRKWANQRRERSPIIYNQEAGNKANPAWLPRIQAASTTVLGEQRG
jgi:glycosyltransferase involved in cell wall biosynthesis